MKSRSLLLTLWIGTLLLISACQTNQPLQSAIIPAPVITPAADTIDNAPKVLTGQFANGMTYVIRKKANVNDRAELRLLVKVGSLQEDEEQRGLAHFVEHMAFNGSQDFPKNALIDYIQSVGMKFGKGLNATTSFDNTIYKLNIPTDDQQVLAKGFQIIENWAHKVNFDPAEIEKERGVIFEELRRKDSAEYRLAVQHRPVEYQGGRYVDRFPMGMKEVVAHSQQQDLLTFYQKWYQPQNMVVLAVGDFAPTQIKALMTKYLASIPRGNNSPVVKHYALPDHQEMRVSIATDPQASSTAVVVRIDEKYLPVTTYDGLKDSLKCQLFASLLSLRLQKAILDGTMPAIGVNALMVAPPGQRRALQIKLVSNPGESQAALEIMFAEIYRIAQYGFNSIEFTKTKRAYRKVGQQWLANITSSQQLIDNYIQRIMKNEPLFDDQSVSKPWLNTLEQLSLGTINAVASDWLKRADNRSVFISAADDELPTLPDQQQLLTLWQQAESAPYQMYHQPRVPNKLMVKQPPAGEIVESSYREDYDLYTWQLSNGAKVVLKNMPKNDNMVQFKAYRMGGLSLLDDQTYQRSALSDRFLDYMGVADFTASELQLFLVDKKIKLNSNFYDTQETLEGKSLLKDIKNFMALIHLKFSAPRKDQQDFTRAVKRSILRKEKAFNSPSALFLDAINNAQNEHNPRYTSRRNIDAIRNQDLELSYNNYRQRFSNAADFTFMFVGHFSVKERAALEKLVTTYIASLPGDPANKEQWQPHPDLRTKGHLEVHLQEGMDQKAKVRFEQFGPVSFSENNQLVFQAVSNSLQVLLRNKLREELGGTYNITVKGRYSEIPRQEYVLWTYFDCQPERVNELVKAVNDELLRIKRQGISAQLLANFKKQQALERNRRLQNAKVWIDQLDKLGNDQQPIFYLDDGLYNQALQQITVAQVNSAINDYLDAPNSMFATLLPKNAKVEIVAANK